jgi:hypothetical protein
MDGSEEISRLGEGDPITKLLGDGVWIAFGSGLCEDALRGSEDADKLFEMYINVDECGES